MNQDLKHRLVGALVLLALGVALWPVLFDSRENVELDRTTQVPPAPVFQRYERIDRATSESDQVTENAKNPGSIPAFEPAHRAAEPDVTHTLSYDTAKQNTPQSAAVVAAGENDETTATTSSPQLDGRGLPVAWVLQVASLSKRENAEHLRDQLLAKGFPAYIQYIQSDGATVARVFVGPKVDRQHLVKVKRELDKEFKINSLIARFEP